MIAHFCAVTNHGKYSSLFWHGKEALALDSSLMTWWSCRPSITALYWLVESPTDIEDHKLHEFMDPSSPSGEALHSDALTFLTKRKKGLARALVQDSNFYLKCNRENSTPEWIGDLFQQARKILFCGSHEMSHGLVSVYMSDIFFPLSRIFSRL